MHPAQAPINWGGAIMWRGTTLAKPLRSGSSFIGLGTHRQRMVIYPISHPDPATGLALINWIAELTVDNSRGLEATAAGSSRSRSTTSSAISTTGATTGSTFRRCCAPPIVAYENPMIDRDPVPSWIDGPVALIGDAAHAMYPTGSNGASQAIIDARVLGAQMRCAWGDSEAALAAYDAQLCKPVSELILRNRGAGPFGLLNMVDERCGGHFDDIDAVIPPEERRAFMERYQAAAGFARDQLNAAPPTLAAGARVGPAAAAPAEARQVAAGS